MKLIVGLGNPGEMYKKTRHNLGFLVIDYLLNDLNLTLNKKKFNGTYVKTKINGENTIIAKPLTYMNNSGQFVIEIMTYYKVSFENILVIVDDKDLSINSYKLVSKGSSAGQKGIEDIIEKIGTSNFTRLRAGIGFKKINENTADYVLKKFSTEQNKVIEALLPVYCKVMKDFTILSFKELSNKYNRRN